MIFVNEMQKLKSNNRQVLEQFLIILSPYAPHIAEELWNKIGKEDRVINQTFPLFDQKYLVENSHVYPISINGKMRAKMEFGLDMSKEDIQAQVLASEVVQKWLDGKEIRKFIFVPKKIVNVVV